MQADPNDLWKRDSTRHPSVAAPDNLDTKLWRYLAAEKFRWLVENRRLYMPRLEQLAHNDPREGTMPDGQAAWWREAVKSAKTPDEAQLILQNVRRLKGFVDRFRLDWFVSCWSLSEAENFAFWQIYGRTDNPCSTCGQRIVTSGQSVAITTTFRKLEASLPAHIDIGLVNYPNYDIAGAGMSNMFDYVMSKRHFYRYESEVRAIAHYQLHGFNPSVSNLVKDHLDSNMINNSYAPSVNVSALIDEVILHPESTQEFVDEIRALCSQNALPAPRVSGMST